jgi:hypothetical protein
MPDQDGTDPIADHELIYRRVPLSTGHYDPEVDASPSPLAFKPTRDDLSGLSVYRAKYKNIEEAAQGRPGKSYYVAVLRVGDLRAVGIDVAPRPLEGDPGHAEITGLTYDNRKDMPYFEWQTLLAEQLCLRVEGPFPSRPA